MRVRLLIHIFIASAIGVPNATMKWKYYWRDIIKQHRVMIHGWPSDIPIGNLSDVATSFPILEQLHDMWSNGSIGFRALSEGEFQDLEKERLKDVQDGKIIPPARKSRSNKGTKRREKMSRASGVNSSSGEETGDGGDRDRPTHASHGRRRVAVDDGEDSNEGIADGL